MNIDWSKAPEGATHYAFVKNGWKNSWYKVDGDFISCMLDDGQDDVWSRREIDKQDRTQVLPRLISRPVAPAWNGEGLPPVGTKCEAKTTRGWSSGTIIAHGLPPKENLAVWQEDGELIFWGVKEYFRPIRTPEQIAAEQKKVAIKQTIKDLKAVNGCGFYSIAEDLYDAGYRKITDVDTE